MKRLLVFTLSLGFWLTATAQVEFYGTDIPSKLAKTTLAAVMSGSEAYQVQLKQAVEQNWKLSNFEFVDEAGFEYLKGNPDYSFLYLAEGEVNGLPVDMFTLAIGNKSKKEQPLVLKQLIVDKKKISRDGAPMVHLYVKNIHAYVKAVEAGEAKDRTFAQRMISSKTYRLKEELPLMALETDFDATMTPEKRNEVYRGEIKIVSQDAINDAILEEKDVAVADVVLSGERREMYCYKYIFDAATGALLYYQETEALHGKKQGFIENDLSSISKAR